MKRKRIMLAAPGSGSGKTTITCALLQALKDRGQQVISYKCGPDYIDPMFHKQVIGIPAKNLDTFFTDEEQTKALFLKNRTQDDFCVMEGVMGLFDGLGGVRKEGSSYHLAEVTVTPIILVVDAKGMGRSILPLIAGFLAYDKANLIHGVILNRMSKSYYEIVKPLIETELGISVFGFFPECKELQIKSRHLGLVMPGELLDIQMKLQETAEQLKKTVDVEAIVRTAEKFAKRDVGGGEWKVRRSVRKKEKADEVKFGDSAKRVETSPIIAVAKDEAFCFYYEDNLFMLQEYGAQITYFSPLHEKELPSGCSGLLLGGGYPELYAKELSANREMREAIKQAIESGMPVVAECGGFMYLHSEIVDKEGRSNAMVRTIPATCHDTGKLVRFGYIEIEDRKSHFLPKGERIKGHEFHYFDSSDNGGDCQAVKPVTGKSYACIMTGETYWMGFPHLYYPSNPIFAESYVEKARRYMSSVKQDSYNEIW